MPSARKQAPCRFPSSSSTKLSGGRARPSTDCVASAVRSSWAAAAAAAATAAASAAAVGRNPRRQFAHDSSRHWMISFFSVPISMALSRRTSSMVSRSSPHGSFCKGPANWVWRKTTCLKSKTSLRSWSRWEVPGAEVAPSPLATPTVRWCLCRTCGALRSTRRSCPIFTAWRTTKREGRRPTSSACRPSWSVCSSSRSTSSGTRGAPSCSAAHRRGGSALGY
mmetsp:Transcript_132651/g.335072  ORF Transcript_132651/g.335072 Transcript_132651/m.335072 type:complete len:223 (-) Transcript_132651:587-1255(-)